MYDIETTKQLVRTHIKGKRKGNNTHNYEHSLRVFDLLKRSGYSDQNILQAGLLHDIVEDSYITFDILKYLGYNDTVITIVKRCSHDKRISDTSERRLNMMVGILDNNDIQSFVVKLADITDNLSTANQLSESNFARFLDMKCKFFFDYFPQECKYTFLWREFEKRYCNQKAFYLMNYKNND